MVKIKNLTQKKEYENKKKVKVIFGSRQRDSRASLVLVGDDCLLRVVVFERTSRWIDDVAAPFGQPHVRCEFFTIRIHGREQLAVIIGLLGLRRIERIFIRRILQLFVANLF